MEDHPTPNVLSERGRSPSRRQRAGGQVELPSEGGDPNWTEQFLETTGEAPTTHPTHKHFLITY